MVQMERAAAIFAVHWYIKAGDAFIWKMPGFNLPDSDVDDLMNKAAKHKSLVLDLRGNGGGAVKTLQRMIGNLFDHNIKIADAREAGSFFPIEWIK